MLDPTSVIIGPRSLKETMIQGKHQIRAKKLVNIEIIAKITRVNVKKKYTSAKNYFMD